MARIGPTLLAQRVEDDLVIVDEASGEEVVVGRAWVGNLKAAIDVLYPG